MSLKVNWSELDQILSDFVEKQVLEQTESLRKLVLKGPKHQQAGFIDYDLTNFRVPTNKLNHKILLGIIQWYLPSELRFLFNLWLEENWGPELLEVKAACLASKDLALAFLLTNDRWNDDDFFGNVINNNKEFIKILSYTTMQQFSKKKVIKYTGWCRGPQDKGSRGSSQSKIVLHEIISTVEFMKQQLESELFISQYLERLSDIVRCYKTG